jgi:hypothetical protein
MTLNHDQANQVAWNYKCDKAVTKLRVSYEDRKKAIHRHSRKGFLMIKAKTQGNILASAFVGSADSLIFIL